MSRRRYDATQRAALDALAAIHLEKVSSRAAMRLHLEAQLRGALNDLELRESRAANDALASNVTKTDIGRAIGTANWNTLHSVLDRIGVLAQEPLDDCREPRLVDRESATTASHHLDATRSS